MVKTNRSVTLPSVYKNCQTLAIQDRCRNWCLRSQRSMNTLTLRPCRTTEVPLIQQHRISHFTPSTRSEKTFFRTQHLSFLPSLPMPDAFSKSSIRRLTTPQILRSSSRNRPTQPASQWKTRLLSKQSIHHLQSVSMKRRRAVLLSVTD